MKSPQTLLIFLLFICNCFSLNAQESKISKANVKDSLAIASEITVFFDSYGDDLRMQRREAIAKRYDSAGYFRLGNGNKRFYTFEQIKTRYLGTWMAPKSF